MIWVDYCILAVLVVSTLTGLFRGFARETLGIFTWVLALWLAWAFGDDLSDGLTARITGPELRLAVSYAVLFLGGLLAGAIGTHLVCEAIRGSGFSPTDRTLGAGFGFVRGVVLVAAFILVAGTMGAREDRWWQESMLVTHLEWLADGLRAIVPERWLQALGGDEPATPG